MLALLDDFISSGDISEAVTEVAELVALVEAQGGEQAATHTVAIEVGVRARALWPWV